MYDVSGVKGSDVEKGIKEDWMHLVRGGFRFVPSDPG
jgi:hypothetical protein